MLDSRRRLWLLIKHQYIRVTTRHSNGHCFFTTFTIKRVFQWCYRMSTISFFLLKKQKTIKFIKTPKHTKQTTQSFCSCCPCHASILSTSSLRHGSLTPAPHIISQMIWQICPSRVTTMTLITCKLQTVITCLSHTLVLPQFPLLLLT